MKRILILLMAALLILCGCAQNDAQQIAEPSAEATEATFPPGLYVADSPVEQQSGGAIREYALNEAVYPYIGTLADKLLLITSGEKKELLLLMGDEGIPVVRQSLPEDFDPESGAYQTTDNGFIYYDSQSGQAVCLDVNLQEHKRIQLPFEIVGFPVFAADGSEVFYCTGKEVHSVDFEKGLPRLIRSFECNSVELVGAYFNGEILACCVETDGEKTQMVYISSETGENRSTVQSITSLETYKDRYLACYADGVVTQRLFGKLKTDAQLLTAAEGTMASALELNGALCWNADDSNDLHLNFYDLEAGKQMSGIVIPGSGEPHAIRAAGWSHGIWLLTEDPQSHNSVLLQWKIEASRLIEDVPCIAPAFTAESPDEAGLQVCQQRVDEMNDNYGVFVKIWTDAVAVPNELTLVAAHQPEAIDKSLDELEKLLTLFPEDFLRKAANGKLQICIVRSVDGVAEGTHYWADGEAYILLPTGVDVENVFLEQLGFIIDSHVLGNSAEYDYWYKALPSGFEYGEEATYSDGYLSGEGMAFTDAESMGSVTTDRSHIFRQAMKADNAETFQSETMQNKLRRLCVAIRDAWGLKKKSDVYHWEQYLNEPVAYKK